MGLWCHANSISLEIRQDWMKKIVDQRRIMWMPQAPAERVDRSMGRRDKHLPHLQCPYEALVSMIEIRYLGMAVMTAPVDQPDRGIAERGDQLSQGLLHEHRTRVTEY